MKKKILFFITVSLLAGKALSQQPGDLDSTFAFNGILTSAISTSSDYAYSMVVQDDGKIVVAGTSDMGGTGAFLLVRYMPNGTIDETFGEDGIVLHEIGVFGTIAFSMVMDESDRFVLGGMADGDMVLSRFLNTGELDESFGDAGNVIADLPGETDRINALALQEDGKIVAAGFTGDIGNNDMAVLRFLDDGNPDDTFGDGGIVIAPINQNNDEAKAVVLDEDGNIILGGWAYNNLDTDFALARFLPDGTPDDTFGNSGTMMVDFGGSFEEINDLKMGADGKIIAAGNSWLGMVWGIVVARFNPNGFLDSDFGDGGVNLTSVGSLDNNAFAMVLQDDGKAIAAGYTNLGAEYDFALVRCDENGQNDNTFGLDGTVITHVSPSYDRIYAAALQPDGKLVVAGYTYNSKSSYDIGLARYHTGEVVDNIYETENRNGIVIYPNPAGDFINIELSSPSENVISVEVFDRFGKRVLERGSAGRIELPRDLNAGIYFLRVVDDSGVYTSSFVR